MNLFVTFISNAELTIEWRMRIIALVFMAFILWLEAIPTLNESRSIDLRDDRTAEYVVKQQNLARDKNTFLGLYLLVCQKKRLSH
jgi:hypothetical protein